MRYFPTVDVGDRIFACCLFYFSESSQSGFCSCDILWGLDLAELLTDSITLKSGNSTSQECLLAIGVGFALSVVSSSICKACTDILL